MGFPRLITSVCLASALFAGAGCQSTPEEGSSGNEGGHGSEVGHVSAHSPYAKPGFHAEVREGRLWVFETGSEDLQEFLTSGEPAKNATKIGVGPLGMTVKSGDLETIEKYLVGAPGYHVELDEDGRIWVFEAGSDALAEYQAHGEPAKNATKIGAGPMRKTVKSDDLAVIDAYLATIAASTVAKPGFVVDVDEDGRIWAFEPDSEGLADYLAHGEPAKNATLIGAGPGRTTVKSVDKETALAYVVAAPGFYTEVVDGRIWVFHEDSPGLEEFKASGEPAKNATKIGVGPLRMTVKSEDLETIQDYLDTPK